MTKSLSKFISLSLVTLFLLPAYQVGPSFATALRDPSERISGGTIEIDKGTTDTLISVDPTRYFTGEDSTRSNTTRFDEWLEDSGNGYENSMYFSSRFTDSLNDFEDGIAVFWTIKGEMIELAFIARAKGWVGFGLSDTGGMVGSDVLLYSVGKGTLEDAFVTINNARPITDEVQSVTAKNVVAENDFIIVEVERALDTMDTRDKPFLDDSDISHPPTRIIAAWGDGEIGYHGQNRVQGHVRFFGPKAGPDILAFRETMQEAQAVSTDLRYTALSLQVGDVPAFEDSTRMRCFEFLGNLFDPAFADPFPFGDPVHIVGIERIEDNTAEQFIRRATIYAANYAPGTDAVCFDTQIMVGGEEDDTLLIPNNDGIADVIYTWSPGVESLAFPPEAGILFNGEALLMEVAYHNPTLRQGVIDQSGFRIYYTTTLREHDIGVLRLGSWPSGVATQFFRKNSDEFSTPPFPLGEGPQEHVFTCPSECTENRLPQDGITVVREQISMNTSPRALRMSNTLMRNGETIREGMVPFYSSSQSGYYSPRQDLPFNVLPGDTFKTTCYYNAGANSDAIIGSTGGNEFWAGQILSTETHQSDEQCTSILYYYPRDLNPTALCTFDPASENEFLCLGGNQSNMVITDNSTLRVFGLMNSENTTEMVNKTESSGSESIFQRSKLILLVITTGVGLLAGLA